MYFPKEDSFFLSECIQDYLKNKDKNIKILDMGSGSGIQTQTCIKLGIIRENILCVDIDEETINYLRSKNLNAIQSDLFKNLPFNSKNQFDLIIFNPPYLPEDKYDKNIDTSGGKKGDEIILTFLENVKPYLKSEGKILLLISSLTPLKKINNLIEKLNFKKQTIAEKPLFFEKLEIWEIS